MNGRTESAWRALLMWPAEVTRWRYLCTPKPTVLNILLANLWGHGIALSIRILLN